MRTAFFTKNPSIAHAIAEKFSLPTTSEGSEGNIRTYGGNEKILILSDSPSAALENLLKTGTPLKRAYFADFGLGTSSERRMGDVILPNAFLPFDEGLFDAEIDKNNRDDFIHDAVFLDCYEEQRDYDFGEFGLSVGGISVSSGNRSEISGNDLEMLEKIGIAYGSDVLEKDGEGFVRTGTSAAIDVRSVVCISGGLVENFQERPNEGELSERVASILAFLEGAHEEIPSDIPELSIIEK